MIKEKRKLKDGTCDINGFQPLQKVSNEKESKFTGADLFAWLEETKPDLNDPNVPVITREVKDETT